MYVSRLASFVVISSSSREQTHSLKLEGSGSGNVAGGSLRGDLRGES